MTPLDWLRSYTQGSGSKVAARSQHGASKTELLLEHKARSRLTVAPLAPANVRDPGGPALAALASGPRAAVRHRSLTAALTPTPGQGRCKHPSLPLELHRCLLY